MARVITYSELERMRASVAPISSDERIRIDRKEELKRLSEDRIQHWPNTLDANRTKKESFMKDREAKDELRRQGIDKQVCAYAFLSLDSMNEISVGEFLK
jgi:hypothetical protein